MHALLPAAGFGTRFLPWTKAIPKEMLPIGDRPVIHFVAEEAVKAGITDIVIVISKGKEAIRHYFTEDPELNAFLEEKGKTNALAALRVFDGVRFQFVYQPDMKGLGDAVRCGLEAVPENEPVAVLLADTIIRGDSPLPGMRRVLEETGQGSVTVQPVPTERATRYGVCGGKETAPGVFALDILVEKPDADQVPRVKRLDGSIQHMAFAARYVFPAEIRDHLAKTPPGKNGEIQLTDAMNALLKTKGFNAQVLKGERLDIGNPEGFREALHKI